MAAADLCPVIRRERTDVDRIWVWEWQNGDIKYVALVNGHRQMWATKAEALKSVEEYQAACEARKAEQQASASTASELQHPKKPKKNKKAEAPATDLPSTSSPVQPASVQLQGVAQPQQFRNAGLRQETEALVAKVAELKARREAAESFCSAAATACALPSRPRPAARPRQLNAGRLSAAARQGRPSRRPAIDASAAEIGQASSSHRKKQQDIRAKKPDTTATQHQVSQDALARLVSEAVAAASSSLCSRSRKQQDTTATQEQVSLDTVAQLVNDAVAAADSSRRNRSRKLQDTTAKKPDATAHSPDTTAKKPDTTATRHQVSRDAVAQLVSDAVATAKKIPSKQGQGRKPVKNGSTAANNEEKPLDVAFAAEQALKALAGLAAC